MKWTTCRLCGANVDIGKKKCEFCDAYDPVSVPDVIELLRDIENRFDQARVALSRERRIDDVTGIVGWYHHLDVIGKVGISSTAYALNAVSMLNARDPDLIDISEGILKLPSKLDLGNVAGSPHSLVAWPMQSVPGVPLVEPTCYVLQQLVSAGLLRRQDERVLGALGWQLRQQLKEHAWGASINHAANVYITALVCQTFQDCGRHDDQQISLALAWLEGAQNDDGGWGLKRRDGNSNAWCTAHSLIALHYDAAATNPNKNDGVVWLRKNYRNKSWSTILNDEYVVHSGDGDKRVHYEFQALPIVLIALDKAGVRPLAPEIIDATKELLAKEKNGIWIWPNSSRKTIFNLCHAVQAMRAIRDRFANADLMAIMVEMACDEGWSTEKNVKYVTNKRDIVPAAIALLGIATVIAAMIPDAGIDEVKRYAEIMMMSMVSNPIKMTAGASLLGIATGIRFRWSKQRAAIYAGIMITIFVILKQGESGLLSILASAAAGLVLVAPTSIPTFSILTSSSGDGKDG